MAVELCLRERAERYDGDLFTPRIVYRLSHQPLSDLATTKGHRNFGVINDDQPVSRAAVGHLCLDAIDDQSVTPPPGSVHSNQNQAGFRPNLSAKHIVRDREKHRNSAELTGKE
jgi:hypothetical protein